MTTRRLGWVMAAVVVVLGWLAGYWAWHGYSEPYGGASLGTLPFTAWETVEVSGLGLAGYGVAAVLLRGAGRWRTRIGWAAMVVTTLLVGYLASFAWFGGICLDPEDDCITTWPSRVLPLVGGLAALCLAAASCEIRRRVAGVGGGVR